MVRYVIFKSIPAERLHDGPELSTYEKLKGVLEERVKTAPDGRAREAAERELRDFVSATAPKVAAAERPRSQGLQAARNPPSSSQSQRTERR